MKKILAIALCLIMVLAVVACEKAPAEADYKLGMGVVVSTESSKTGNAQVDATIAAVVTDAEGKIVSCRIDVAQNKMNVTDGAVEADKTFKTKIELGNDYGMAGKVDNNGDGVMKEWFEQTAAFEAYVIGKTAADIAALQFVVDGADAGLVAGCTMKASMPVFQSLVAKAFAYERNVTFKTSETVTLGLAIDAKISGNVADGAKINAEFAAVAIAGGKVVASMIDSAEATYSLEIAETTGKGGAVSISLTATLTKYAGTKNEQGDAYDSFSPMASGRWYEQAQAFANTAVGKTVAELADLSTDKIEGSCSIYTGGYKAAIVRAAGYAR